MAKVILRMEPYDPDAKDADGDGIVQERTPWERPVGAKLLDKFGNEIAKGAVENARPDGMQVIDKNGNKIDYIPSYAGRVPSKPSEGPKSALSDQGALSLAERGLPTIGQIVSASRQPSTPQPAQSQTVEPDEKVSGILNRFFDTDDPKRRKMRDALRVAQSVIDQQQGLNDDDKDKMLEVAAYNWAWREEIKTRFGKGEGFDLAALAESLWNPDTDSGDEVPHFMVDRVIRLAGRRGFVPVLNDFFEGVEDTDPKRRKVMQALLQRVNNVDGAFDDLDEEAFLGQISYEIWEGWKESEKKPEKDVDTLEEVFAIVERKMPEDPELAEIAKILERPDLEKVVRPELAEKVTVIGGIERYPDAEYHLQKADGDVSEVPPHALVTAMFDGNIYDFAAGRGVNIKEILTNPDFYTNFGYGSQLENDRFTFQMVKHDEYIEGMWVVWKVRDKEDGKEYFIKTSQYGANDAMLEAIGEEAMTLVGFPAKDGVRMVNAAGSPVEVAVPFMPDEDLGETRWMMIPHYADIKGVDKRDLKEIANFEAMAALTGYDPLQDEGFMQQLARIAVLDYVFDNTDRHAGNLMFISNSPDKVELVPIDHGLLFGGRANESFDVSGWDQADWDRYADERAAMTPREYHRYTTNTLREIFLNLPYDFRNLRGSPGYMMDRESANSERPAGGFDREMLMVDAAKEALERLAKVDPDELFSPERFERRGMKLSTTEINHLNAMKRMYMARLEYLTREPDGRVIHLFPN